MKVPKSYKGYKVKIDNKMKWYGETDDRKKVIKINVKKSLRAGGKEELADTIKHEKTHANHPDWTEKETENHIKHKSSSVTSNDKTNLAIKGLI